MQCAPQGGKWKNTFHAYPAQMAFPMGVVWTVQPFWSHHPRYPLPEVRVAAPSVEGDFRDAPQQHIMQLSCWMRSNSPQCCSWVAGCAPTAHNAAELLDAQQLPTVLLLGCYCTKCTAMMSYALQCASVSWERLNLVCIQVMQ